MITLQDLAVLSRHKFSNKLDFKSAAQLLILRESGVPNKTLADFFGCSKATVRNVGRTAWKEVSEEYKNLGKEAFFQAYNNQETMDAISARLRNRQEQLDVPVLKAKSRQGRHRLDSHKEHPFFVEWLDPKEPIRIVNDLHSFVAPGKAGWYFMAPDDLHWWQDDHPDYNPNQEWHGPYTTSENAYDDAVAHTLRRT